MKLDVYFRAKKAGELFSTANRGIVFCYDEAYLLDPSAKIYLHENCKVAWPFCSRS